MNFLITAYGIFLIAINLTTFLFYGWDKRQAKTDGWRVPEARLHWMAICGGGVGAIVGQQLFRHKTRKFLFPFVAWVSAIAHLSILIWGITQVVL